MEFWTLICIFLSQSMAMAVEDVNGRCYAGLLTDTYSYCSIVTGFNPFPCENMECFLACVESFVTPCQQGDLFYNFDPRVERVKIRSLCYHEQAHVLAITACQVFEPTCSIAIQLFVANLIEMAYSGSSLLKRERLCRANSLWVEEKCEFHTPRDECTADMASYKNELVEVTNSFSVCQHPQNNSLFIQFGHESNCTTGNDTFAWDGVLLWDDTLLWNDTSALNDTSVWNDTLLWNDTTISPALTNVTVTPQDELSSKLSTTPKEIVESATTKARSSANIPIRCSDSQLRMFAKIEGCPLLDEDYTYCDNLECNLLCYENLVKDCDSYNVMWSKVAFRTTMRLYCNYYGAGIVDDVDSLNHTCWNTLCWQTLIYLLSYRKTKTDSYCRLFEIAKTCSPFIISDVCPEYVGRYRRNMLLSERDYCQPENSPIYGHFSYELEEGACVGGTCDLHRGIRISLILVSMFIMIQY